MQCDLEWRPSSLCVPCFFFGGGVTVCFLWRLVTQQRFQVDLRLLLNTNRKSHRASRSVLSVCWLWWSEVLEVVFWYLFLIRGYYIFLDGAIIYIFRTLDGAIIYPQWAYSILYGVVFLFVYYSCWGLCDPLTLMAYKTTTVPWIRTDPREYGLIHDLKVKSQ